jgi:DNA-binding XRE family transcriptional regulator
MDMAKMRRLQAEGWSVGDASDFLGLSPAEAAYIELRLDLADCFRSLRKQVGLTQTEAAQRLGSSQSRVAKMEAADPSVSLDLLVKALLTLGATPNDISRAISKVA